MCLRLWRYWNSGVQKDFLNIDLKWDLTFPFNSPNILFDVPLSTQGDGQRQCTGWAEAFRPARGRRVQMQNTRWRWGNAIIEEEKGSSGGNVAPQWLGQPEYGFTSCLLPFFQCPILCDSIHASVHERENSPVMRAGGVHVPVVVGL